MFDKQSSNQRPQHAAQGPSSQDDGEVLWPLAERDDIGEDDLSHGDDASSSDALD